MAFFLILQCFCILLSYQKNAASVTDTTISKPHMDAESSEGFTTIHLSKLTSPLELTSNSISPGVTPSVTPSFIPSSSFVPFSDSTTTQTVGDFVPTMSKLTIPTTEPSVDPTNEPTEEPSIEPTNASPTFPITYVPTSRFPTTFPTRSPTKTLSKVPTAEPTVEPSESPTVEPSNSCICRYSRCDPYLSTNQCCPGLTCQSSGSFSSCREDPRFLTASPTPVKNGYINQCIMTDSGYGCWSNIPCCNPGTVCNMATRTCNFHCPTAPTISPRPSKTPVSITYTTHCAFIAAYVESNIALRR